MEITQYHREQRLLGSAGNVIARPSDSSAELEQLGNVFTEFGLASEQQRLKAQYHDQINSSRLQIAQQFEEYQNSLDPNNTDNWLDDLETKQKSYDEIKLTNERAKAEWSDILEAEKFRQKKSVSDFRRTVDARNFQRNYYVNKNYFMESASKQQTPGDYDQEVIGSLKSLFGLQLKEGAVAITPENLETAEGFDNPMFHSEELRKNEARAWLKDTNELYDENQKKKFMDTQLNIAINMPDGLEYLNSLNPADYGIDLDNDDLAKLRRDYTTQKNAIDRIAKLELEARQKKTLQDFDLRLADPENANPVSVPEVNAAYERNDLDRDGWKDTLKVMKDGPIKEDDDEALMRVNIIADDLREHRVTTSDEAYKLMKPYKSKLTSATWQGQIKALPGLETTSEYGKSYFDQLDRWRKETSTDKKVMASNPMGATMAERNYNYNRYHKILTEFEEKNPNATPEDWNKTFRETIAEPVAKSMIKEFFASVWSGIKMDIASPSITSGIFKTIKSKGTKGQGELLEPKNVGEFEFEVQRIAQSDKKAAREYYEKWASKW